LAWQVVKAPLRQRIAEEERYAKSVSKTQLMNYSWSFRPNSEEIHEAFDA